METLVTPSLSSLCMAVMYLEWDTDFHEGCRGIVARAHFRTPRNLGFQPADPAATYLKV
jgi:hypothetical protein